MSRLVCTLTLVLAVACAGTPTLLRSAADGDVSSVEQLLQTGADVNALDGDGRTPLIHAAANGHTQVVGALLDAGADANASDFGGFSALINAAEFGHTAIVELLLERGADPTFKSPKDMTASQHARRRGHQDTVVLLHKATKEWRLAQARPTRASSNTPSTRSQEATPRPEISYRPRYGKRIAAVIGINDYAKWPPLRGASGDARRVAQTLRELGFDEILELYDATATRAGILNLLGARLERIAKANDLVVIFFAGHGHTETLPGGEKRGYIIPADADTESVFSTGISMEKLRDLSNRIEAKHVYYAMDSCYSGLGFTRGISIFDKSEGYVDKLTSLRAVQMVTAGMEGEEAIEIGGEGIFTTEFIKAIRGRADGDGDGFVTASEIGAFVRPKVTRDSDTRQTPQFGTIEGTGEIVFELR